MYGSGDHDSGLLCHSDTRGNMGVEMIDWVMNILLAILITLALLCLVQMGVNFWNMGWY